MRIYLSPPHQTGRELEYVREVLDSNYLAPVGPMLDRFEDRMRDITGYAHAVALNSATAALELSVRHLLDVRHSPGVPPLVLASSLTFIASVAPAIRLGCEVRLIDAEMDSWTLDPVLLSHALAEARAEERPILCVIPTDLYGQACDLSAIEGLCAPHRIPVLCDSAEALGVQREGPPPWASVYSFNGNKILTCSGGGILATHDDRLDRHARKLSMQAREASVHYEHRELGYNFRLSNLLAGIAVAQLEVLEERVAVKRRIFEGYRHRLKDIPGISFMPEAGWNQATRWLSVIRVHEPTCGTDRETLRLALEEHDIESRPVWKPLHQQPALHHLRIYGGHVADTLFKEGLCLPSGTALTEEDLDIICTVIKNNVTNS